MSYDYEIGIIGGGPAGSIAAIYLVNKGFTVCLFEKKNFPRETICGEFLSKEVIETLKELNLFHQFISLDPNELNKFRFINEDNTEISADLKFDCYSLKRSVFDNFLLKEAGKKGAKIFQPAGVNEIIKLKDHYKIKFELSGKPQSVYVKDVIAAYGKQNELDKQLNRDFIKKKSGINGIKFHIDKGFFKSFDKNEIRIYAGNQIYCGINEVNDEEVTLCFLEDRKNYNISSRAHLYELFNNNTKFNNLFNDDLKNVIYNSKVYGTGNIYFGKRNIIENGVFMLGDAAGIVAPLAGDGIGMAFESAKLLADLLLSEKEKKIDAKKKYLHDWEKLFSKRIFTAKVIQNIILNPLTRNTGVKVINYFPGFLNYLIKSTRT